MTILRRASNSFKRHGLRVSLIKLYVAFVDHWFDFRHGTDTCGWLLLQNLHISSNNKVRGVRYEPARIVLLRKMFECMKPLLSTDGVMVDLGSGKGRVLLIASEFGFRETRGVEFAPELCAIARDNCARYKKSMNTKSDFKIIESDVVDYAISADENVFVMFNPFDDVVLGKVLENIASSLRKHPRKILIGYYSPEHNKTIARHGGFAPVEDINFWGYHFTIYSNEG
jgi:SAM-dependent methyltransferase